MGSSRGNKKIYKDLFYKIFTKSYAYKLVAKIWLKFRSSPTVAIKQNCKNKIKKNTNSESLVACFQKLTLVPATVLYYLDQIRLPRPTDPSVCGSSRSLICRRLRPSGSLRWVPKLTNLTKNNYYTHDRNCIDYLFFVMHNFL
jgi:hypothetical protein